LSHKVSDCNWKGKEMIKFAALFMGRQIQMVDLQNQYLKIQEEIDEAILGVVRSSQFIRGPVVERFCTALSDYLQINHVIGCGNGTDALQIALMALDLKPGDEVIVPAFTYVATAEVIALLGLTPVLVDVYPDTFNINIEQVEQAITNKTKAIVPVHLFGQISDMESIMAISKKYEMPVIEDNAQAIGAKYTFSDGSVRSGGGIGHIGTTSFFPSKNLGCYGDGGALTINDAMLAEKAYVIGNHGQYKKYYHEIIGINSRLDAIQAAILEVKLNYLSEYEKSRQSVADFYDYQLKDDDRFSIPVRDPKSTHVFHQYTLKINNASRNDIQTYLKDNGIPSMIYYPLPLNHQKAFETNRFPKGSFPVAEKLCGEVLSLPMSPELSEEQLNYICTTLKNYKN